MKTSGAIADLAVAAVGNGTEPVVIVDQRGVIRDVSSEFCRSWLWRREAIVGQPLATIIPEGYRPAHYVGFSRYLLTGKGRILDQPLNLPVLDGQGMAHRAELSISVVREGGEELLVGVVFALESIPAAGSGE